MNDLFSAAEECLTAGDPDVKVRMTLERRGLWLEEALSLSSPGPPGPMGAPGRPQRPRLVPPRALPRRGLGTALGRAALIHAIAHIEFNAINLAWDAVYRFRGMPRAYYDDWTRVAAEEADHFQRLRSHLRASGHDYGDFDAHDGLWEMAQKTAHDPLVRMALVPRVLEARGLDVTPGMIERLAAQGDALGVAILEVILREEIGHVAVGSRWFRFLCDRRGLEPRAIFLGLLRSYMKGQPRGPFNHAARLEAGFEPGELQELEQAWTAGQPSVSGTRAGPVT
jgi:uncharacterized ferritin-like protein (DUF455 family)